ncbi:MAG: riboflavin synthase [Syntrophales bacterium]|jgi:riboflavin synthase|nr:riboflavin synthase [Syntrophales bacterium]MDY0043647.1 riboflavin synthase [Syntrophales bacterium]
MFTGIIEGIGIIDTLTFHGDDLILRIKSSINLEDSRIGDSISVSGACLTIIEKGKNSFSADVSAETLLKTNLGTLKRGDKVNLEKALRLNSFLGGHLVLGHVDCTATIHERSVSANSIVFGFGIDTSFEKYIVEKGSVTVDGISLTVNQCQKNRFYVNIIPHTAASTTLGFKKAGDIVNIETDILGKYIEKLIHPDREIDMDFLAKHGFIK